MKIRAIGLPERPKDWSCGGFKKGVKPIWLPGEMEMDGFLWDADTDASLGGIIRRALPLRFPPQLPPPPVSDSTGSGTAAG